jgi:hypothetical protein
LFLVISVLLIIFWCAGQFMLHETNVLVHLLLLLASLFLAGHLVRDTSTT